MLTVVQQLVERGPSAANNCFYYWSICWCWGWPTLMECNWVLTWSTVLRYFYFYTDKGWWCNQIQVKRFVIVSVTLYSIRLVTLVSVVMSYSTDYSAAGRVSADGLCLGSWADEASGFRWSSDSPVNFLPQVGGGGSGQCRHGDLISSSPWQPAGDPALHRPAEGQHPHLEEGEMPQKVWTRFWSLPVITYDYRSTGSVRHAGFQLEGERRVFLGHSEQVVLRERVKMCIVNKTLISDVHVFESITFLNDITGHMIWLTCYLTHTLLTHRVQTFTLYKVPEWKYSSVWAYELPVFLCSCWTAKKPADLIFLLSAAIVLIDPVHLTALTHLKVQDLVWTQVQFSRILHLKQRFL